MASPRIAELIRSTDTIVRTLLDIRPGEEVLIIGDSETEPAILYVLSGAVQSAKAEPLILVLPGRDRYGEYPLRTLERAVQSPDVVIMCTMSQDMTHTTAIQKVRWKDHPTTRFFSMIGRDIETLTKGAARADYAQVLAITSKVHEVFQRGRTIRVTSDLGTDLMAEIGFSKGTAGYNQTPRKGQLGCFPDGEVNTGPIEGTAKGVFVVDGPVSGPIYPGFPQIPIRITVEKGRAVKIEGGSEAKKLADVLETTEDADNIAEIAIGTNYAARLVENIHEFKRGIGRVHIALGNNVNYGGTTRCRVHLDLGLSKPTVTVDDTILVDHGHLMVGN